MRITLLAAIIMLCMGSSTPLQAQQDRTELQVPHDLAKWSLHCFCISAIRTPHQAIHADNNGEILYHARVGVTRRELEEAGIAVTDSQILLMRTLNALDVDGEMLRTAFPVIGPDQLARLRPQLRRLAESLIPDLSPHVSEIVDILRTRNMARSQYAVVFGYAVDGVLWDRLRERDALPETHLTREEPLWRGAFWAQYPRRGNVAGVNEVVVENAALVIMWTEPTARVLSELNNAPDLRMALRSLVAGEDAPVIEDATGRRWKLGQSAVGPGIPVIHQRGDDPLHMASLRIVDVLAAALADGPQAESLLSSIEGVDREHAMVIVAHELIWGVMEALISRDLVQRPAVMDEAEGSAEALLSMLLVRVQGGAQQRAP